MYKIDPDSWRGTFIAYAPIILWTGVIFFLSSGEGSAVQTSRIIRPILEFFFPSASEETLLLYHFYIRKFAHFAEYAILAFWALRAFSMSSREILRNYRFLIAMALVMLVAGLDEFNQSFDSSRTGSVLDVALDVSGGLVMTGFLKLLRK